MDLLCWMALASRALATISSSIGFAQDEVTLPLIHAHEIALEILDDAHRALRGFAQQSILFSIESMDRRAGG